MSRKTKYQHQKKISSVMMICLVCVLFSTILIRSNTNYTHDENSENFSRDLKISTISWTTTEVVSTESTDSSGLTSIAVDGAGNVHVVWDDLTALGGSLSDKDIFYKFKNAITGIWTTTEVVSTESVEPSSNPKISVDNAGNAYVAWGDLSNYAGAGADMDIFYKFRNFTGASWNPAEVVTIGSASDSVNPGIAVDSTGNVHVAWEEVASYDGSGSDRDIFYKLRNATLSSWTATEVVSNESTGISAYPSIAVDSAGDVHVAWADFTNYSGSGTNPDAFYKLRNATSSTWTTTEVVSTETITGGVSGTSIAVENGGNVHVAWNDNNNLAGAGPDNDISYKNRNANSGTWTTTEVVSTESSNSSLEPSIGVDSAGNAYVTWTDWTTHDGSGTDSDIFYKLRNTTLSSWTTTEVVSTESSNSSRFSSIAVNGVGNVYVAWYDLMYYGGSGIDQDVFYKGKTLPMPPSSITVTNPDGTIKWESNTTHYINWTSNGSIANVKIYFYKNGIYQSDIIASTPNDGSYLWTIPSGLVNSTLYQIKINDVLNASTYDFSDYFEIYTPSTPSTLADSIMVTNPSGSAKWENGTTHAITWTSTGNITNVKLYFYLNGIYKSDIIASTPNDGLFLWTIPSGLVNSTLYQVKITDVLNASTYDFSDYFEIYTPSTPHTTVDSITVTNPSRSAKWECETNHYITWTSTSSITSVKIELHRNGTYQSSIIASTSNHGLYLWTIPSGLVNSTLYQIRIIDISNSSLYDFSDYFEIYTLPTSNTTADSITITYPTGLVTWQTGTDHDITWTSTGSIVNVKIELYISGTLDSVLNSDTTNDGSYSWTIPTGLVNSTLYQIKISDLANSTTYDYSDYFTIYDPALVPEEIPGYNLYFLFMIIGTISVVLINKKHKQLKK